jgi:hypothetical protein
MRCTFCELLTFCIMFSVVIFIISVKVNGKNLGTGDIHYSQCLPLTLFSMSRL